MRTAPLPPQFRQNIPAGKKFFNLLDALKENHLHTVCEEAKCPNRTDCYGRGTLTFQILGDICTRRCGFCAEKTGRPNPVDLLEPARVLNAVTHLNLSHVVLTAPARDDLKDGGASVFAETVRVLKENIPHLTVEVLVSDLNGDYNSIQVVLESPPDIFNHNIETVKRLTPRVRSRATYERSLDVLKFVAKSKAVKTKSGLMVGLGETREEIFKTLRDLRKSSVQFLTVGQYLSPSDKHLPMERYYSVWEFDAVRSYAYSIGFEKVLSGSLVRSSYHADEYVP